MRVNQLGKNKLDVGIVGFGHLGQFHAEKYTQLSNVTLRAICDTDPACLAEAKKRHPVETTLDYRTLFNKIDAVNIVAPTSQHYTIAKDFLKQGVHVLLEKPMTATVAEADELIHIAKEQNVHLQIGHLERFNPTIQRLFEEQHQPPYHIHCQRLSPFNQRGTDVNVILDLMIHDLDLILQFIPHPIVDIKASGHSLLTPHIDRASAWIEFKNGSSAHLYTSRVSESTKRALCFHYPAHDMIADLRQKTLKKRHPTPPTHHGEAQQLLSTPLPIPPKDALYQQLHAFTQAVIQKKPVAVNGEDGREALAIALQITAIIH